MLLSKQCEHMLLTGGSVRDVALGSRAWSQLSPITGTEKHSQTRNLFATIVPGSGRFQLSDSAGLGYGLGFWVGPTVYHNH